MTRTLLAATAALTATGLSAAEWEDLSVNSINRLPARTYAMPLASEEAALTDALEPETPYRKSLNGDWKFSWAGCPDLRVKDFWRADFDDSDWFTIDVPSCVEMRGFGAPGYTNVRYPHAWDPKRDIAAPTIRDRHTDARDYNPVSSYRTTFTVPADWAGRDVILRFDGVYSAYYVWVNGHKVGYAEDSKLPSEFDVTPYLKDGENLLAVEVYRWCDGSFLEDQDMFRFSGIFRDVTLWAKPKDGIWDFAVTTALSADFASATLNVAGCDLADAKLYDADGRLVGSFTCGLAPLTVPGVRLWSAEDPYLYTLVIRKGDDIRAKKVGFKEQKIVGNRFLVNGRPIKFKGVNRHETNPDNGRAVTLDDMMKDITLFKRYNIDTVRTSHYPNDHRWYALCDRYGIYVIAEANVEGHEPSYGENGLGRHPEWDRSIVERNTRHAVFYRNNPSVTMWSMGNETGHGDCFRHAIAAVKGLDPTRPVHWERGNRDADVDSRMYPSVEWLEARGQFGDTGDGAMKKEPGGEGFVDSGDHSPRKCAFLCEYAHAMGNAIGNFQEYWDAFYRHDSLSGGCIWDWVDQAVWKETGRLDPKTGRKERFLAYGGDFDEEPNDGPFNCNGVIDPERHVTAKLVEVGHVFRNLVVSRSVSSADNAFATVFELWNRFSFTRADAFLATWKLLEDGVVRKGGAFEPPALAPLARCRFTVPGLAEALAATRKGSEIAIDFAFVTKEDAPWAKKGWAVARDQVFLTAAAPHSTPPAAAVRVSQTADAVTFARAGTKAVFSRATGTLAELTMDGRTILKDAAEALASGPRLTCARAFTDNDIWLRKPFYASGLTQLRYHARPIEVRGNVVRTVVEVTGSKSAGFTHRADWSFAADGTLVVSNSVMPHGTMPKALPRLGLTLRLDGGLDRVAYYGRGPRENYIDRRTASFLGRYEAGVDELAEAYVRPQDNGYRTDVRWVSFTDAKGNGVRFAASEPLFVQALRCGWEDLEFARHRNGQQRFRTPVPRDGEIYLNLDVRQLGLGGGSCGPQPMGKYIFPIGRTDWTLCLSPLTAGGGK